jgi:hypothetical protein
MLVDVSGTRKVNIWKAVIDIELNSTNKNIRDMCRGITEFKKGYKPKTNLVKDERGDRQGGSSTNFD